ncbi:MAG: MATE family efflux transporter [Rhodobacteraceae bacterium]|nr:MATE family efflux transporter [Paracoccaceae bacterium]
MIHSLPGSVTYRRILTIAVPIIFSNAAAPLLGAADTGVVGQLGDAVPIGAVGVGSVIFSTLYGLFLFLRMGTSGLTSQARGRQDADEVQALFFRSTLMGLAGGVVLILLQWPIVAGALLLVPASGAVEDLARQYLMIRIYSAPAAIAVFGMTGWLIAQERTASVLFLQLFLNGLNILLDLLFVLVLHWGVPGVAVATVVAEWSAFVFGLVLCRTALRPAKSRLWSRVMDRMRIMIMLRVNRDIMIRTVLLTLTMVSFVFFAAGLGDTTLAANQILLQFMFLAIAAIDGFSFAAEALVGLAIGSGNLAVLRQIVRRVATGGIILALLMTVVILAFGPWFIHLMTTAPAVRILAREYVIWVALVPVLGTPSWILDGIFIGAVRARDMRNSMIVSFAVYALALGLAVPILQNHGLWLAWILILIARAVTLGLRYPRIEATVRGSSPGASPGE